MEVSSTLTCPCRPGKTYKDLKQHYKTKIHQAWVAHQELKDTRVQSKTYENELERLRRRLEHKEAIEAELLHRIRVLEKELKDAGVFLGL